MKKYIFLFSIICCVWSCNDASDTKITVQPDYKPMYHFSPDSNWANDPNGLVYYDGQYHLFYQHNPFENKWGHMSWGHSTSTDLVHWKTLPVALYEEKNKNDSDTTMIFSGSAVVDAGNTSGFGTIDNPPMVAIYTGFVHTGRDSAGDHIAKAQNQSIAYSIDKGLNWVKYSGNPVLDIKSLEYRDPKVFWYQPQQKWVMLVSKPDEHETWFYQSKNLKQWTLMSKWGKQGDTTHYWECPDLIECKVNNSTEKKWVMLSSSGTPQKGYYGGMQYFVGDFDGTTFTTTYNYNKPVYLDFGKDFYAAICYNNAPNDRKIMIGWMSNWEYGKKIPTGNTWRGIFAMPRELSLVKVGNDYKLLQQTTAEFNALQQNVFSINSQMVDGVFDVPYKGTTYQLELTLEPGMAKAAGIKILKSGTEETVLQFDAATNVLSLNRMKSGNVAFHKKFASIENAPVRLADKKLKLKILVDKCTVEVFINDGETVISELVFPIKNEGSIQLFSEGGKAIFSSLKILNVQSAKILTK